MRAVSAVKKKLFSLAGWFSQGVGCVTDISGGRTFRRDEVFLMSTWTSHKVCDVIPIGFSSCHHRDRPSSGLSSHVCLIASLSIFIEFIAIKEAKGIFLWKKMIFFYPVTIFPLEKPFFSVIVCIKYLLKIYLMAVIV